VTALSVAVVIMAKAPRAGEVKTRLCPPLTAGAAASLYRCFLLDKIAQVRALKAARPFLAYTPAEARGEFEALAPGLALVPQQGADLGTRLLASLRAALADGHPGAIAIDSDTPTLPTAFLQQAVDLIADPAVDVVLGPTDDGGYYLIGVRAARPGLFEGMPWSTPRVLEETLRRAAAAGLRPVCLPPWFDVDTPADLARLRQSVLRQRAPAPLHTRAFLAEHAP
jgi:hypothetical protein